MLATKTEGVSVPGRQIVVHAGVRFEMSPGFWLRRWTRFPRFFESHNPSMRLRMTRVGSDEEYEGWDVAQAQLIMDTAGGEMVRQAIPVPQLNPGETDTTNIHGLYCPHPGNVVLSLNFFDPTRAYMPARYPVYSYRVDPESGPWTVGAWLLSLLITAGITLLIASLLG